jgi:hypothetical protein
VELSALEAEIIRAVQNISWDAQLWFPIVQRTLLELRTDAADEQIHAAVVTMIEKHALVPINPYLPYEWEIAISNGILHHDPSLRTISTSADSQTCLVKALSSYGWVDEIAPTVPGGRQRSVVQESALDLTYLESKIILAVEHLGWFSFLWFPVVHREDLNFGSNAPDADVHRAFPTLIRKRALIPIHEEPGDKPDWQPEPSALKAAVYKTTGRRI